MSSTLFQNLANVTTLKTPWDKISEDCKKDYSPFMMNRYVSFSKYFIDLALIPNINVVIPPEANYNYYLATLPKRNLYFKYLKKSKKEEYKSNEISALCHYFKCSSKDLTEILTYADKSLITDILKSLSIKK